MAPTGVEQQQEVVTVDMPTPEGWAKKFTLERAGRYEVIFVSPTGVEIKNKSQLNQYLKANPGGPASSEFDWGTGETPRRSSLISEKVKVFDSPEGEKIPKRSRKGKQEKKEEAETEEGKAAETGKEAPEADKEAPEAEAGKEGSYLEMKPVEEVKTAPSEDAGKTEDSAVKVDVPAPDAVLALAEEKKAAAKQAENDGKEELAPPTENSLATAAPEAKAEAAAPVESSAPVDGQPAAAVNNGQMSPG
ncbi:hypothetical protein BRADI_4g01325v3, partial [Brachypodium distachyon]